MAVPSVVRAYPSAGSQGADADTYTNAAVDSTGAGANGAVLVGFSYQGVAGTVTAGAVSVCTFDGVPLTPLVAFTVNVSSNTGGAGLYILLNPNVGATKTFTLTMTGGTGTRRLTVNIVILQDVAASGNTSLWNNSSGGASADQNATVTASVNALAMAFGAHGDVITGAAVGSTQIGAINNRATDSAAGCFSVVSKSGAGGATVLGFTSSLVDHWTIPAVELVGTVSGGGVVLRPMQPPGFVSPMGDFNPWMGSRSGGIVGTAFTQTNTGSITPTGATTRSVVIVRVGSITPTGIVSRALAILRAGSVTPAGQLTRASIFTRVGSITPTGLLQLLRGKTFTGSVTPTGAANRQITITRTGSITPAGQTTKAVSISRSGSITPTGSLATLRAILKLFTGSITPSGQLTKAIAAVKTGSITPTGILTRATSIKRIGSITPTGALSAVRAFLQTLTGSITPTGKLARAVAATKTGTITPAGIAIKAISIKRTGSITPTGVLTQVRAYLRTFVGSITPTGKLTKAVSLIRGGTIAPAGLLRKAISQTFTGLLTTVGSIVNLFIPGGSGNTPGTLDITIRSADIDIAVASPDLNIIVETL